MPPAVAKLPDAHQYAPRPVVPSRSCWAADAVLLVRTIGLPRGEVTARPCSSAPAVHGARPPRVSTTGPCTTAPSSSPATPGAASWARAARPPSRGGPAAAQRTRPAGTAVLPRPLAGRRGPTQGALGGAGPRRRGVAGALAGPTRLLSPRGVAPPPCGGSRCPGARPAPRVPRPWGRRGRPPPVRTPRGPRLPRGGRHREGLGRHTGRAARGRGQPSERVNNARRRRVSRVGRAAWACAKKLAPPIGALQLFICHDTRRELQRRASITWSALPFDAWSAMRLPACARVRNARL